MYENVKILSLFWKEIELPLLREEGVRGDVEFNRIIFLFLFRSSSGAIRSIRSGEVRTGCEQPSGAIDRVTGATL